MAYSSNRSPHLAKPIQSSESLTDFFDCFKVEANRLKSFQTWPVPFINKNELVKQGCFYTGRDYDRVQCAYCHMKFYGFKIGVNPFFIHARISPHCPRIQTLLVERYLV
jgi:Inhibitor of Apoptosis domain